MAYLPGGHSPSTGRMHPQTMESPLSESNGTSGGVKPLEFKAAMRDFGIMFPTLDSETIETVLRANNGAVDATIDQLLEMCDNLGGGSQVNGSGHHREQSNLRRSNSPATLAVDNVDSYNLTLASLTPPKNTTGVDMTSSPDDTNVYANLPFQDNVTTAPGRSPMSDAKGQPEVPKTSYKYQTAMFKFKNPFMGPLPDDFLRIKSDPSFDQAVQYSRQKRKQVENIRNEKFTQNFYSTNGAHADSEFDNIVTPVSGDPPVQSAWGAADVGAHGDFVSPTTAGTAGGVQSQDSSRTNNTASHLSTYNALFPNPSPSSGAIPKNYNARSWSGTARSTISTFGKKLSLKKNSDNTNIHSTSTLPATGSHSSSHGTNLTRSRGYTPSTMNLLGDCDDEEDDEQMLLENGGRDADDEMISLQSSKFPPNSRGHGGGLGGGGSHLGSSRVEELSEDSDAEVDYNPSPSVAFQSPQSSNQKSSRSLFAHEKRLAPNRPVIN